MAGLLKKYTLNDFRAALEKAKNVVVITGAGVSAESGIPTYRGSKGLWRNKDVITNFATPTAFKNDPASVWEFYHYRRELVLSKKPNAAHYALAKCEEWFRDRGDILTVITSNVDGFHKKAGSKNVLEMHGSLFETKCSKCGEIKTNYDSPICESLKGKEKLFNDTFEKSDLPKDKLPHCKMCGGLLRPNVVWYNESLDKTNNERAWELLDATDLAVIIGSSALVFPFASYANHVSDRGVPVAEFNLEKGPYTDSYSYFFKGPASETIPDAFDKYWRETFSKTASP